MSKVILSRFVESNASTRACERQKERERERTDVWVMFSFCLSAQFVDKGQVGGAIGKNRCARGSVRVLWQVRSPALQHHCRRHCRRLAVTPL